MHSNGQVLTRPSLFSSGSCLDLRFVRCANSDSSTTLTDHNCGSRASRLPLASLSSLHDLREPSQPGSRSPIWWRCFLFYGLQWDTEEIGVLTFGGSPTALLGNHCPVLRLLKGLSGRGLELAQTIEFVFSQCSTNTLNVPKTDTRNPSYHVPRATASADSEFFWPHMNA